MSFEEFWAAYPRKVAKAAALKAWNKVNPEPGAAMRQLAEAKKEWAGRDPEYIPHASTWLRRESFESDAPPPLIQASAEAMWDNDVRWRAALLRDRMADEKQIWEYNFAQHRHDPRCHFGELCIYLESKRPIVPSVEELMERIK